jgi:adenylate cyclase
MLSIKSLFARYAFAVIPLVLAVFHLTGWMRLAPLEWADRAIYDARLRATMQTGMDGRIVIVDVDEPSLAAEGQWPWPREKLARLVNRLFEEQQVAALGFDMVFAEPQSTDTAKWLRHLGETDLASLPEVQKKVNDKVLELDGDAVFAAAIAGRPVVLGHYFSVDRDAHRTGHLPAPALDLTQSGLEHASWLTWTGYAANLPKLMASARAGGTFNAVQDEDGVIRSVPLLSVLDGEIHQSFALAMLRVIMGAPSIEMETAPSWSTSPGQDGLVAVRVIQEDTALRIPVNHAASTLVPYRGTGGPHGGAFRYVSATQVLEGKLQPNELRGKVILVGTTAPGLWDVRVTPVSPAYPGVEVHATLLVGFMDGTVPVQPDYALGYELALVLASGLLLTFVLPRSSAIQALLLMGGLLVALVGINTWLYLRHQLVLPVAACSFLVVTAFVLNMAYGYLAETRAKRHLASLFGMYVPPELVDQMVKSPDSYGMAAEEREVTVMFCDIRGFTSMAEKLSPDQIQSMLNHVLSELSAVIRHHGGTIDKYIGDCVMAFWGAPLEDQDHASHAVAAALDMVAAATRINAHGNARGWPTVKVGIGINTGKASVGDMGSNDRRAYTVVGDVVNVASRLEALTKEHGVDVIAGVTTRNQCATYGWRHLGLASLKGRVQCMELYVPANVSKS